MYHSVLLLLQRSFGPRVRCILSGVGALALCWGWWAEVGNAVGRMQIDRRSIRYPRPLGATLPYNKKLMVFS